MLLGVMTPVGLAEDTLRLADFSGRYGEWEKDSYDMASYHNSLISLKSYQQTKAMATRTFSLRYENRYIPDWLYKRL